MICLSVGTEARVNDHILGTSTVLICGSLLAYQRLVSTEKAPVDSVPVVLRHRSSRQPPATIPEPVPVPATTPSPVPAAVAMNPDPLPAPLAHDSTKPSPFPPAARQPAPVPRPQPEAHGACAHACTGSGSDFELRRIREESSTAAYQADLRQANAVLNSVRRTRAHSEPDRFRESRPRFYRQAAQYHDRDLATAAELARRARVLTQDLAGARK